MLVQAHMAGADAVIGIRYDCERGNERRDRGIVLRDGRSRRAARRLRNIATQSRRYAKSSIPSAQLNVFGINRVSNGVVRDFDADRYLLENRSPARTQDTVIPIARPNKRCCRRGAWNL